MVSQGRAPLCGMSILCMSLLCSRCVWCVCVCADHPPSSQQQNYHDPHQNNAVYRGKERAWKVSPLDLATVSRKPGKTTQSSCHSRKSVHGEVVVGGGVPNHQAP